MSRVYSPEAASSVQTLQDIAYARLGLSDEARLPEVAEAINRHDTARSYMRTLAGETRDAQALYATGITKGLKSELNYCTQLAKKNEVEAIQTLIDSLKSVHDLPLNPDNARSLDEVFLDFSLEVLSDEESSTFEKLASITLSYSFAAADPNADKTAMVIGRRLAAEQVLQSRRASHEMQLEARQQIMAIDTYLEVAGLEYVSTEISSNVKAGIQKTANLVQLSVDKHREALSDGGRAAKKAAAIATLASISVVSAGSLATASEPATSGSANAVDAAVIAQTAVAESVPSVMTVPMIATAEVIDTEQVMVSIEDSQVATVPMVPSKEPVNVEEIPEVTIVPVDEAEVITVTVEPVVEPIPEETTEEAEAPVVIPDSQAPKAEATVPMVPTVTEEERVVEDTAEANLGTILAPNNDVNVASGETPQQALARIVASRDIPAAAYSIRKMFSDDADTKQPPVNPTLSAMISKNTTTLKAKILEAAHGDAAYSEKAYFALAYLNAVTESPSLLSSEEVTDFVASISDQGEDYRNKLFAAYLTEAKTALSAEAAGSYTGIEEQYRSSIETLYAYTTLAGVSAEAQTAQIEAIKTEEARIAEEARQKALAEQAQQQAGYSEAANAAGEAKGAEFDKNLEDIISNLDLNDSRKQFIRNLITSYKDLNGQELPVNINVMLAQAVVESQYGESRSAQRNNLFGIKAGKSWTGETIELPTKEQDANGNEYSEMATWRVYPNYAESIKDYAFGLIGSKEHFQDAVAAKADENGYLDGLLGPTMAYATDKRYKGKILERIEALRIREMTQLIQSRAGAMQAERDRVASEEAAAEAQRIAEAQKAGDMREVLTDGKAILEYLKDKYENVSGKLDASELTERASFYKNGEPMTVRLNPEAAKGFDGLAAAYKAHFGVDLRITDHYRDYDAQVRTKKQKGDLAATPGKSLHGWGLALDLASGIATEGSETHEWMEQNAHLYGWENPYWAQKKNGTYEPWHWEFVGNQAEAGLSDRAH